MCEECIFFPAQIAKEGLFPRRTPLQKHADLNFNVSTQARQRQTQTYAPRRPLESTQRTRVVLHHASFGRRLGLGWHRRRNRGQGACGVCAAAPPHLSPARRAPQNPSVLLARIRALQRGCSGCGGARLNLTCIRSCCCCSRLCASTLRATCSGWEASPPRLRRPRSELNMRQR